MKFWMILLGILMILTVPYRFKKIHFNDEEFYIIHNILMPWAVGFTVGKFVYTTYRPGRIFNKDGTIINKKKPFIHHESIHVKQWIKERFKYPYLYVKASIDAILNGDRGYDDNKFEVEAYKAEYEYCKKHNLSYNDRYINK